MEYYVGALEAEEARESMFTEKYQRLETLTPDEDSFSLIQNLMGSNVEPRTNFMFNKIDFSQIHE